MQSGRARTGLLMVAAMGMVAAGCSSGGGKAAPPTTPPPGGLTPPTSGPPAAGNERRPLKVSFLTQSTSCERFADAVRPVAIEAVGPYGFAGGTSRLSELSDTRTMARETAGPMASAPESAGSAPADNAQSFSSTNVQEAGVDEPDSVKTDGKLLVTTLDGKLRVMDVTGPPSLVGTLDLPDGGGNLLLVGDRALILSGGNGGPGGQGGGVTTDVLRGAPSGRPDARPGTRVTVVDLKDPAKPTVTRTHTIDGSYVDARLVGGVARIVTRSQPDIPFPQPKQLTKDPNGSFPPQIEE
ncbi:MAG: beta-propeller domain-containing protein, partial [Acidimicrobiales bacterium]